MWKPRPSDQGNTGLTEDAPLATPRTGVALPSERYRISGIPEGFVPFPDRDHIGRASETVSQLVSHLQTLRRAGGRELAVRFCHVLSPPGFPINLFAFHVWGVDSESRLIDPLTEGDELTLALVANQPVELQLENAIEFLYSLAGRQGLESQVRAGDEEVAEIIERSVAADREAARQMVERYRYGWREAARGAVDALESAGFTLSARYELDVFPRRLDIDRRLPLLRRLYNEFDLVRSSVDRIVGTVGGREGVVRGGMESIRGWTQQQLTLLDIRRYMNHSLRDGEVCGNGYLAFNELEPFAPYAVRPEDVRIVGGSFSRSGKTAAGARHRNRLCTFAGSIRSTRHTASRFLSPSCMPSIGSTGCEKYAAEQRLSLVKLA